ncbi:MAG: sigma-70 family RNA polymerase sigma factor [candidate division WOR-3 bacterium]
MDVTDLEFIRRAKSGERAAFDELVRRYSRRTYQVIYSLVRSHADTEDLLQEAFIRVHRYLGSFHGSSSFYTWLYRIVVNLSVDHLRRRSHEPTVDYDDTLQHTDTSELQPSAVGDGDLAG